MFVYRDNWALNAFTEFACACACVQGCTFDENEKDLTGKFYVCAEQILCIFWGYSNYDGYYYITYKFFSWPDRHGKGNVQTHNYKVIPVQKSLYLPNNWRQ